MFVSNAGCEFGDSFMNEVHVLIKVSSAEEHYFDGICGDGVEEVILETRKNVGQCSMIQVMGVYESCEELNEALYLYDGF